MLNLVQSVCKGSHDQQTMPAGFELKFLHQQKNKIEYILDPLAPVKACTKSKIK